MTLRNLKLRRRLVPEGIEERFALVQGHRMRYLTGGCGPALLLIHGLMGFSFSFSENLTELAQHFTVSAPDLINAGYSERADLPCDLRSAAVQVVDFMDALGISQADMLGSSYGATVVMALAAVAPKRVRTLILVAPAHCGSEHGRWQVTLFSSAFGLWLSRLVRLAPPMLHGFFIKRMYGDPSRVLPGTISEYARPIEIPGTTVAVAKVMRHWKSNFQELCSMMPNLAHFQVHLIWGDRDPVVPLVTVKELLREIPSATLSVIPSTGHLPYEELPEKFNQVALDILLNKSPAHGSRDVASAPPPL